MAATKDPTRKRHVARGTNGRKPVAEEAQPRAAEGTAAAAIDRPALPAAPAIKSGRVSDRIASIAELSESLEGRRALRRIARLIAASPKSVHKIALLESEIGGCLERAELRGREPREAWLELEAAVWALAWLARSRRAGGSAGGLLEQLVRRGRVAVAALQARDTLPAVFVITLATLFPDIESCAELGVHAVQAVDEEINRLVSEQGSVRLAGSVVANDRVRRWAMFREAMTVAAQSPGTTAWSAATDERFMASIGAALRFLGDRGRMLVGIGRLPRLFSEPILRAARSPDADARIRRTARAVESGETAAKRLLPRDLHDAAGATAILRSGWGPGSIRVAIEYRDTMPRLEIAVGDRLLVDGPWHWSVTAGSDELEAEGPWTFSGLESDKKSTFFEIAAPLAGGLRLERTLVVVPDDRIVVVADAITRTAEARVARELRLTSRVTLAPGLEAQEVDETREVFLYDTGMRAMVLPLGLGEWKAAGDGGFTVGSDGLTLEQHGAGRLHAPLWFDCDPRRVGRPVTWRQLTVADTRQNLPRSMAAGYRVQVGHDQWLLYRALDEPRNRTLLGCNVSCEFLLGRVGRSGEVKRMVEIQ